MEFTLAFGPKPEFSFSFKFSLLSDELDAQIFYPKENICLFLALYVLKYSYG